MRLGLAATALSRGGTLKSMINKFKTHHNKSHEGDETQHCAPQEAGPARGPPTTLHQRAEASTRVPNGK